MSKRLAKVVWSAQGPQVLGQGNFLTLLRREACSLFEDGQQSAAYAVECAVPPFCDAVVLLLHAWQAGQGGEPLVVLRRSARPCVSLRSHLPQFDGLPQHPGQGVFWELPAGGVEPGDLLPGGGGLAGRASLEAWEETGLKVPPQAFRALGPPPFQAPAYSPERLHYLAAQVDAQAEPQNARPTPGDGHAMEEGGEARFLPLAEALAWCASGRIADLKSELGLLRLSQFLRNDSRPSNGF